MQAAGAYREAASHAPPGAALPLLQKAADQLFRAGRVEEGAALAYEVHEKLGLGAPASPFVALVAFLFFRVVLALRGTRFRERAAAEIPPLELARIDTSWSITAGLSTVDPIRGAYFQARHLRLALRAGEPYNLL